MVYDSHNDHNGLIIFGMGRDKKTDTEHIGKMFVTIYFFSANISTNWFCSTAIGLSDYSVITLFMVSWSHSTLLMLETDCGVS